MKFKRLMASFLMGATLVSGISVPVVMADTNTYASTFDGMNYAAASVNMDGIKAFVTRMYRVCLDREPEEEGLNGWAQKLAQKEATGCSVAYGFVFSPEFIGKNPTNEAFVNYMYDAFFGREADEGGFKYWVDLLNNGASKESIFCGFANSEEFSNLCNNYGVVRGFHIEGEDFNRIALINLFVERLYNVVLDRTCDEVGMPGWTVKLNSHEESGCSVAYGFVFSPEFLNKHTCNDCYVEILYNAFLGRGSDTEGKASWVSMLNEGKSREFVFNGFAGSLEFAGICSEYGIEPGSLSTEGTTHAEGTCTICGNGSSNGSSNGGATSGNGGTTNNSGSSNTGTTNNGTTNNGGTSSGSGSSNNGGSSNGGSTNNGGSTSGNGSSNNGSTNGGSSTGSGSSNSGSNNGSTNNGGTTGNTTNGNTGSTTPTSTPVPTADPSLINTEIRGNSLKELLVPGYNYVQVEVTEDEKENEDYIWSWVSLVYAYYLNDDGTIATGWVSIDKGEPYNTVYVGLDGSYERSEVEYLRDDYKFYFDITTGKAYKNAHEIDGILYHFDEYGFHLSTADYDRALDSFSTNYFVNKDGVIQTSGWQTDYKGQKYYVDSNTHLFLLGAHTIDGEIYFFDDVHGYLRFGFISDRNHNLYYLGNNGVAHKGWLDREDKKYYFGSDGIALTGIQVIDNKIYCFKYNGEMLTGWQTDNDGEYYFDEENGAAAIGFKKLNSSTYYFDSDGKMIKGWKTIDGKQYYFDDTYGRMCIGAKKIDSKYYLFDTNGVYQTQPGLMIVNGNKYYVADDGTLVIGWKTIDGSKYYFNPNTLTGLRRFVDDHYRFFDGKGVMQTGWQTVNNKTYFFESNGASAIGWITIEEKIYYFDSDSVMQTGWLTLDTGKYYLNSEGVMQTGWQQIEGEWYYFNEDGSMVSNDWEKYNDKWCFLKTSGVAAHSEWIKWKSNWYYFDDKGYMVTGWKDFTKANGTVNWYYFNPDSGKMVTGAQTINGAKYYFYPDGSSVGVMATNVTIDGITYGANGKGQ